MVKSSLPTPHAPILVAPGVTPNVGFAAVGTIWYTADLHLGHDFVAGLRGFDSPEAHDATIADNWDAVIRPGDTVWVLGDVTGRNASIPYALDFVARRPGVKHLIAGNHDACHPMHRRAATWQGTYLEGRAFRSVQAFALRKINGHTLLMSHFPYAGDHTETDRFDAFRLRDNGLPLVHGHTHGREHVTRTARATGQLHIGLDAWALSPVPEHQVARALGFL